VANFLASYFPYPGPWELEWTARREELEDLPRYAA
jgi:hypothetical protein